jgi:hypothetical protein
MAVFVACRKVGPALDEKCEGLWPRVPLGREMSSRSASWAAGVYVRAMADQPSNRLVNSHMGVPLQRSAVTRNAAVDPQAPTQEFFGNVVGRIAVPLKVAERCPKVSIGGTGTVVQQPAD